MEGAEIHDALIREVIRMLSRPAIFAATLLVSLGLLANARGQTPPQTGAPPAPAAGQIDTQLSRVYIRVGKTGLGHEHGVEGRIKSGTLTLGATSGAGAIVFDTTSFQADTPTARQYVGLQGTTDADTQRQVNANMLGADVLDVRSFPTATFTVHSIQSLSAKGVAAQYRLDGDFTLHGKTREAHGRGRGHADVRAHSLARGFRHSAVGLWNHSLQQSIWRDRRRRPPDDLGRPVGFGQHRGRAMIRDRCLQPELMDQPDLDPGLHVQALRGLQRINVISRSATILWPAIANLAREFPNTKLRVLDLACGGGDNAVALARLASRAGLPISIHGCDISDCAVGEARRPAETADVNDVQFFCMNVLAEPLPQDYDILISSLFLHHLEEAQAVQLLQRIADAARRAVVICDLQRSWLDYGLAWVGCRLLTRSPIVHVDGPRSVEAAFAISEVSSMASRGGLDGAVISHHWPQRWLLSWRKR